MAVKQSVTVSWEADKRRAARIPKWREEDFRTIVSINADAMIVIDSEGFVLYVNPAAESLFSLPSAEMLGAFFGFPLILDEPVELFILREFKDFVAAEMRSVNVLWAGEPSYLLSFRDLTDRIVAEQEVIHVRDKLDAMVKERTRELNESNELLKREIAERRLTDEKLLENYRFTTTLMGNLPGMVYRRRNVKGCTMEFVSSGCLKLTGYKIECLFNDRKISYGQLIHPDDRERVWDEMQVAIRDNMPYTITYRIIAADQEVKWVWDQGRSIIKNNKVLLEGFITDITASKQVEKALNEAKQRAELYVDLMSHDINNLNHSAMGYLEMAHERLEMARKLTLDEKLLIERPIQSLTNSSALIDNVRKLQQLMTEGVKTKPTDLNQILRELEARSFHSDDRDVTVIIQHVPGVIVEANELIKDIFVNLIENAVKHSDEEKPLTVNVKVEPVNENGRKYYLCVVDDDGPGISDEFKGKLFHRFQRGVTRAYGKGLGLYLVRTLVEGYHGKVWVEDRVPGDYKKGTKLVVMLPAVE
jgi:PAS domain S-box-containing protein